MKEKRKKLDKQLCAYVTAELKQRGIAHKLQNFETYSVIHLNISAVAWDALIKDAKYNALAQQTMPKDTCYLPVVSIRALKDGKRMQRLQKIFGTHCFYIKDSQAETLKYLYA